MIGAISEPACLNILGEFHLVQYLFIFGVFKIFKTSLLVVRKKSKVICWSGISLCSDIILQFFYIKISPDPVQLLLVKKSFIEFQKNISFRYNLHFFNKWESEQELYKLYHYAT